MFHRFFRSHRAIFILALTSCLFIKSMFTQSKEESRFLVRRARDLSTLSLYRSMLGFNKELTIFSEDMDISKLSDSALRFIKDKNLLLSGVADEGVRFKLLPNVFVADNISALAEEPVCVALQSTLDFVPSIHRYLQNWPGSVSYALFTPSHLFYFAIVYIKYLRKCHADIRNQVSWHLSYPNLLSPPDEFAYLLKLSFNCTFSDKQVLLKLATMVHKKDNRVPKDLLYPQNVMRNMARRHCASEWVMCPDVDMIFPDAEPDRPSYHARLADFFRRNLLARECDKCAFVFPLYEVEDLGFGRVPNSKRQLLQYVANNSAQIYHLRAFSRNQLNSNLTTWEQLPLTDDVQVAFESNYTWFYEPIYVVRHGSPPFDERFIGYGMTRNTQVLEMFLSNYTFYVLDTVFLCHLWGLKTRSCFKKSSGEKFRQLQVNYNKKIFYTHFTRELAVRFDRDLGDLIGNRSALRMFKKSTKLRVEVMKYDNASHSHFLL